MRRRRRPDRGDPAALDHILEFLRRERVLPAKKPAPPPRTPAGAWVQAYAQYLREDRGLTEATVTNYAPFIDRFLTDRFGPGPVELARLEASDVVGFVQRQARRLQLKRAKLLTTWWRSSSRSSRVPVARYPRGFARGPGRRIIRHLEALNDEPVVFRWKYRLDQIEAA